jgi:hypothetical protein
MSTTHYRLEKVTISNGTYANGNLVVSTYNVYQAADCKQPGVLINSDLLWCNALILYLKPEDSNTCTPMQFTVKDLFIAPKANFFLVTNMNTAKWPHSTRTSKYCNGSNPVKLELMRNNSLAIQAPAQNPITNLLNSLTDVKQVIDYVFSKPPLLFSVAAILKNEAGDQCLYADGGNAPHQYQLIKNMENNRQNFWDKLHSGTRFGIASYYLYAKRIYKSVFKLDVGDYIVLSIAYYPVVKPPETSDVGIGDITGYYNSLIGSVPQYNCSIYSFHLWRHALYGGFAGVVGGNYSQRGYTLKPECACQAFKLLVDAQTQPEYKESWYHVLYYPTAFYLLLLYLATTQPDQIHDKSKTQKAINDLKRIFSSNKVLEDIQNDTYKNIVKRFFDEIGAKEMKTIMLEGLQNVLVTSQSVNSYTNPIQMLWKYCMEYIVKRVHDKNRKNYGDPGNRMKNIEEYLNNKINNTDNIYKQTLQRELQFFQ